MLARVPRVFIRAGPLGMQLNGTTWLSGEDPYCGSDPEVPSGFSSWPPNLQEIVDQA